MEFATHRLEIGSSKKWATLGAAYLHLEANSVVAQFTNSDLFDGRTNRRGWYLYGSKELTPGVEFKVEFFDSDAITRTGCASGPFTSGFTDAVRKRGRMDLVFTF